MRSKIRTAALGVLLCALLPGLRAGAAEPMAIGEYVDSYAAGSMAASHVPGMVFIQVDRNGVVFAGAYGSADLETDRPMTTDTPLRVGSISKPVTAAIAFELAAAGQIDLDAPVDDYLEVDLADGHGGASTIRQLLQHRGGYPDAFVGSHHLDPDDALDLESWVSELSDRSMAPDIVASYSSVGYTLAGAAIAGAGGGSFASVADATLFRDVGMDRATFAQPAPSGVAVGYSWNGHGYEAYPIDVPDLVPGAGLIASAEDIGRFMAALLAESGTLAEETKEGLLTNSGPEPGLRGYTTGLAEWRYPARTVLYHEGNGIGTSNRMMILPDEGVGIFTAVNGEALTGLGLPSTQVQFIRELHEGLINDYYTNESATRSTPRAMGAGRPAAEVVGTYVPSGIDPDSVLRLDVLVSSFDVEETPDGISFDGAPYSKESTGVFRSEDGGVVFLEGDDGEVYATRGGTSSYRSVAWWETTVFNAGVVAGSLLLLLAGLIVGCRCAPDVVKRLMMVTGAAALSFVALLAYATATLDVMDLFTGVPGSLLLAQGACLGLVIAVTALGIASIAQLRRHEASALGTASVLSVAGAGATLAVWAWIWAVIPV